ncbi:MAG: hypothetical protein LUQ71_03170 [Methanoregula sp.]|nr:hypothetical protein [Methanoregula sp.]
MGTSEEQELQIQKDIKYLTRTLTPDNLNGDVMFAKERGIRSCTPPFDSHSGNSAVVRERLKRVQPPKEE